MLHRRNKFCVAKPAGDRENWALSPWGEQNSYNHKSKKYDSAVDFSCMSYSLSPSKFNQSSMHYERISRSIHQDHISIQREDGLADLLQMRNRVLLTSIISQKNCKTPEWQNRFTIKWKSGWEESKQYKKQNLSKFQKNYQQQNRELKKTKKTQAIKSFFQKLPKIQVLWL